MRKSINSLKTEVKEKKLIKVVRFFKELVDSFVMEEKRKRSEGQKFGLFSFSCAKKGGL